MARAPGGYTRVRRLGRGASGDVWEVRAPDSGERLALKEMDFSGMTTQERELVLQEARILRRLSHPHIVRFVDLVAEDCLVCIVMQYIDGGDMRSLLTRRRESREQFLEVDIWKWLLQIASALLYLHKAKILHRDVKPANIFLTAHSQNAILGDLGIAKVLANTDARAVTQIGTPSYLAPEVWMGMRYSYAADVYSLGCTVYELAELKIPFVANDRAVLAAQACNRRCAPITNTSYSRALRSLVQSMLEKEPYKRPAPSQILLRAEEAAQGAGAGAHQSRSSSNAAGNSVSAAPPNAGVPPVRRRSPLRALSPAYGARLSGEPLPPVARSPSARRASPLRRHMSPVSMNRDGAVRACGEVQSPSARRASPLPRQASLAPPSKEGALAGSAEGVPPVAGPGESPLRRRLSPPPMPSRGSAAQAAAEAVPPVPPLPLSFQVRRHVSPPPPAGPRVRASRSPRAGLRVSEAIDAAPGCREAAGAPRVTPPRVRQSPTSNGTPTNEQQQQQQHPVGTRPGARDRGRSAPRGLAPRSPRQLSAGAAAGPAPKSTASKSVAGGPAPPGTALGGPSSRSRSPGMPPLAPASVNKSPYEAPPAAPRRLPECATPGAPASKVPAPVAAAKAGADEGKWLSNEAPPLAPRRHPECATPSAPALEQWALDAMGPGAAVKAGWGEVVPWRDRVDMSTFSSFVFDENDENEDPQKSIEIKRDGLAIGAAQGAPGDAAKQVCGDQPDVGLYEPTVLFDEDVPDLNPPSSPIQSTVMLLRSVLQVLPDGTLD